MTITYLTGDATTPQGEGMKIISHVNNNVGAWGAGFVLAISKRWSLPEQTYRRLAKQGLVLGQVQFVPAEDDIIVANMIAQTGYGYNNKGRHKTSEKNSGIPLQYDALTVCLTRVAQAAKEYQASLHMPRIGCSLAGGSWLRVEKIIQDTLVAEDIPTFVYDFPGSSFNP
jgi:O-acetyl-ADP-ribose deacetylase (regulator of RNase III)